MKARIVAIVQARMESTRFPGKVMAEIQGRPMIRHVVDRLGQAASVDLVVVATSDRLADDMLADYCAEHGVECFRGSAEDRSEEHTSELQSHHDLVCRLLLE